MCPCTQYVSKSILIRFGVLKQRQNEWTSMSAGWQDLSVAGEKHMRPGAPVLHSAVDLHSVDVYKMRLENWKHYFLSLNISFVNLLGTSLEMIFSKRYSLY